MNRLIVTIAIVLLASASPVAARGGMHESNRALSAPANPAVPPSLTPDPRLEGSAPLPSEHPMSTAGVAAAKGVATQPDPEDAAVDKVVRSICRGC
jgi:hypothetical protein